MKRIAFLFFCLMLGVNAYAAERGYHVMKKLHLGGESGWDSHSAATRRSAGITTRGHI